MPLQPLPHPDCGDNHFRVLHIAHQLRPAGFSKCIELSDHFWLKLYIENMERDVLEDVFLAAGGEAGTFGWWCQWTGGSDGA